jgi:hypothetical protein
MGSAIALLAATGIAWADSNTSVVLQTNGNNNSASVDQNGSLNKAKLTQKNGNGNEADITQSGKSNQAGVSLQHNTSGIDTQDTAEANHGYGYMTQDGSDNKLTIKQTLGHNTVGYNSSSAHLSQTGNHNEADITQHGGASGGGLVDTVDQTALSTATGLTNKLTILQQGGMPDYADGPHYSNENIGTVKQNNTGGRFNELTLTQKGGSYVNPPNNEISKAEQNGIGNTGKITQTGRINIVSSLSQIGNDNDASISLKGANNGSMVPNVYAKLHAVNPFLIGSAASAAGVGQATATQKGDRNGLTYSATGDNNLYGFAQSGVGGTGDDNDISGTTVGSDNQAAVGQWGSNNNTTFSQSDDTNDLGVAIYGDDNGRGGFSGAAADLHLVNGDVTQSGGGNYASISIGSNAIGGSSSNNDYAAKQTGGGNTLVLSMAVGLGPNGAGGNSVAVSQAGGDTATINVTGGKNVLGARQLGGGTNSLEVTITGNLNNASTSMSGDAGALGLKAGSIYQNNNGGGGLNDVNLTVDTDSNKFAVKQQGSDNTVYGLVDTGTGNQAAVIQVGLNNTASFMQNGGGNNVGISQSN